MQIRRFEAKDVQEALREVKEVLGPEAIILSTKTVRSPRSESNRSLVEVIAAADPRENRPTGEKVANFSPWDWKQTGKKEASTLDENELFQRIQSTGLVPEFIQNLREEILAFRKVSKGGVLEIYRGLLRSKLMEVVDVPGPYLEGKKVWAFIGPTGVGKTTTLAKLAAYFHLREGKRITLSTIDTYRIGAVEQLKTYARILGLPLEVAATPEELGTIIEKNRQQDLLFIDTAGRNPHDRARLEELREFLTVHPSIENHLVLSATTKDKDLAQIVQRFRILPIESYIITKIDETEEYGPIFNQLLRFRRPLSYLTNGQRVPEDFELATKVRVANLIFNQIQWN